MRIGEFVRIKRTYSEYSSREIRGVVIESHPVHGSPVRKTFEIKLLLLTGRLLEVSVFHNDEVEVIS